VLPNIDSYTISASMVCSFGLRLPVSLLGERGGAWA
jgi:hypothetical protein